jgi:hypothetical protein
LKAFLEELRNERLASLKREAEREETERHGPYH